MKVAIYTRVSTARQETAMQLSELREYCQRREFEVLAEYQDTISGSREVRPGLTKLQEDAGKHKFSAVVVYRFDRFARSLRQLITALDDFRAQGIEFISIHEGIDTTTPSGRLVFGVVASIAEFERELIRERVKSGLQQAKRQGKRLGRPKLYVNHNELADLLQQGLNTRQIATELHISGSSVQRQIKSMTKSVILGSVAVSEAGKTPNYQTDPENAASRQGRAVFDTLGEGSTL